MYKFRTLGYKGRAGYSNNFNFHTGVKVVRDYKIDKNHPMYKAIPIGGHVCYSRQYNIYNFYKNGPYG